ncbi:MAG: integrase [Umezawaea sp.]
MLLRLVYLSVTNAFALLRLLPMSDRDKDVEILVLRHQITVLERQLGKTPPRLSPADRAFFAALLHRLPLTALRQLQLPIRPETVLRWHRDLLVRRQAALFDAVLADSGWRICTSRKPGIDHLPGIG